MSKELLKKIHWKRHMAGLVAFICAGLFLVYASWVHNSKVEEFNRVNGLLNQQKNKNRHAHDQLEIYSEFYPIYQTLQKKGLIGNTNRLQWVETLRRVSDIYRVPGIDFTLHSSEPVTESEEQYFHSELSFETTKLDLHMELLHEGDWYHLMRYMHESANGVFSAEECIVNRSLGSGPQFEGLSGKCLFKWYTLNDVTARQEEVY